MIARRSTGKTPTRMTRESRTTHCEACASNYVESRQRYIYCSAQKQQSTHAAQRAAGGDDSFIKNLNKVRIVPIVRPNPVSPMYEIVNERNCLLSLRYLSHSFRSSSTTRIQRQSECSQDTLLLTVKSKHIEGIAMVVRIKRRRIIKQDCPQDKRVKIITRLFSTDS